MSWLYVIVGLLLLVFIHELGHFAVARLVGAKATRFLVGFPPVAISFRRGETEYGLGLIPLGGYVRIVGMNRPQQGDEIILQDAVEEAELIELPHIGERDDAFVHKNGKSLLPAQLPIPAQSIRRERLLEGGDAEIGEARRHGERGCKVVATVRIDPDKGPGRNPPDLTTDFEVKGGITTDLHVEIPKAPLPRLLDLKRDLVERTRVERPTESDGSLSRPIPSLCRGFVEKASGQVKKGEIDPRFGDGLSGREGRGDGAVHDPPDLVRIESIHPDQGRSEIPVYRGLHRFQRLVTPGPRGHALAPTDISPVIGDLHQDRVAGRSGRVLERSHDRISRDKGLDAGDPGAHSCGGAAASF
jgi:hypothetical protein